LGRRSFTAQSGILHTHDIQGWEEPKKAAKNAVVEVFVHRKAKHVLLSSRRPAVAKYLKRKACRFGFIFGQQDQGSAIR
jgi:hypothetical protein